MPSQAVSVTRRPKPLPPCIDRRGSLDCAADSVSLTVFISTFTLALVGITLIKTYTSMQETLGMLNLLGIKSVKGGSFSWEPKSILG